MLPSLAWGDGVKLQSEVISGESFVLAEMPSEVFTPDPFMFAKVGVAAWDHPLYIIAGHLLVRAFPLLDSLWLVNFISALFGSVSVMLVFLLSYRYTDSLLASSYASLTLAVSHTFWWHSTTPEVYTLFVFLLLASFFFIDTFEIKNNSSSLLLSALFFGLAASTHMMAFLVLPAIGLYSLFTWNQRSIQKSSLKLYVLPTIGFLTGFSLYIMQFIRMVESFSFDEIIGPVFGSTFLSQLGSFTPLVLGESFLSYLFFLTVQFGPAGLVLGGIGIRRIFADKDRANRKIVSFLIFFALFGIFYRVTDQFTFFIPSYVFWAILIGIGSDYIFSRLLGKVRFLVPAAFGLLLIATPFFYTTLPWLAERSNLSDASIGIPKIGVGVRDGMAYYLNPDKRGDYSAFDFGYQTISNLEPASVVIAEWYTDTDEYFILRYFTKVEKLRPDVTVIGWPSTDPFSFDSNLALDLIENSFPEHPVYLASLSDRFYAASELVEAYCVVPENNLFKLHQKGASSLSCLDKESVTD